MKYKLLDSQVAGAQALFPSLLYFGSVVAYKLKHSCYSVLLLCGTHPRKILLTFWDVMCGVFQCIFVWGFGMLRFFFFFYGIPISCCCPSLSLYRMCFHLSLFESCILPTSTCNTRKEDETLTQVILFLGHCHVSHLIYKHL